MNAKIDDMIISKILATLPEEYKHFTSAWESTEQRERILENLTAMLIAEEMRNNSGASDEKAIAFKATGKRCYKCNKTGHSAKVCKSKAQVINKQARCYICNKTGHIARTCNEKQDKSEKCTICKKNQSYRQELLLQEKQE